MKTNTLLSLLQKQGVFIDANCGGKGRCGRCRVQIKGKINPPDEVEKILIPKNLLRKGYRLACRIKTDAFPEVLEISLPKRKIVRQKNKLNNVGLAIDIGTTIIKGALVDFNNGEIIRMAKVLNPQQSWGGDVITRIGFAISGNYKVLRNALLSGIKELKSELKFSKPQFTTIVGNPVMLSFYLGEPVKNFAHYPFEGNFKNGIYIKNPPGYVFGCIGGFVGGDTIAGIIASGLYSNKKPALYIDLGTNGEIALIADKKIYAVSTAAGPAFEGVGLTCGSLAIPGAIEKVEYKKGFKLHTIDNKPPIGFCASGFIDLLAILLKKKWLTEYGMLREEIQVNGFKIEQMDIRRLQLAIGAIHTGIKFLLDYVGICSSRIETAVITGEFGSHLNPEALKEIGIIPSDIKNILFKNDLPILGAIKFLLKEIRPEDIERIRKRATHLELAMQKDFQKRFVDGLVLKPWN